MDANLISYESMLAAKESAYSAYWSMIFTAAVALSSLITVIVAIYAALIARKEVNSWKEQQKLTQLVRLKRAVFSYRQYLEANISRSLDQKVFNEILRDEMQTYLADIFHEIVLAGLDVKDCEHVELFRTLMQSHNLHMNNQANWQDVYQKAGDLQQSIKVNFSFKE